MKVALLRVGLTFKTSQGSRIGFVTMFLPNFQRIVMIGCLTIRFKRKKSLAQARSQLEESVARITI